MFRIVFVLDILNGNAVHAVRGEREKYRPIQGSQICRSSDPLEIISALSPGEVYIADLNRIQHLGDNFDLIKKISSKTRTMVDIGVENMNDIAQCAMIADTVIVGTETASLDVIENASMRFPGRIDVSIDMKKGSVLTRDRKLEMQPVELVNVLDRFDIRDIILLELSKVGTGTGIDRDFLQMMVRASKHNILVGGGIRDMEDIKTLEKIGASGALVATAVHNGKIPAGLIH